MRFGGIVLRATCAIAKIVFLFLTAIACVCGLLDDVPGASDHPVGQAALSVSSGIISGTFDALLYRPLGTLLSFAFVVVIYFFFTLPRDDILQREFANRRKQVSQRHLKPATVRNKTGRRRKKR